jgi:hypothetical protein
MPPRQPPAELTSRAVPEGPTIPAAETGLRTRVLCGLIIFLAVAALQIWQHPYHDSLSIHPDEAAHFVTGVCALDYLAGAFGSNPVTYAESYYVHYPRVAFGHWPPLFYALEAAWYGILGANSLSAMLLVGVIAALAALVLFLRMARLHGAWAAIALTLAFLFLPAIRESAFWLMSDMLASLFTLLAVLALADACRAGARRCWMAFMLWTALAILTKASALPLLLLAPAALALRGDGTRQSRKAWLIGGGIALAVVITYGATGLLRWRTISIPTDVVSGGLITLKPFFEGAPAVMFLLAAFAVVNFVVRKQPAAQSARGVHLTTAALWLGITLASQVFFRAGAEPRYFLPAYFALAILFVEGVRSILDLIALKIQSPGFGRLVVAAIAGLCIASMPAFQVAQRSGYEQVAGALPRDDSASVILVSSDSKGEGAMIVEQLIRDSARRSVVLRATKMLSSSDWGGGHYVALLNSTDAVTRMLDSIPVRFVIMDINGFIDEETRFDYRLLEETLRGDPRQFRLVGAFPLYFNGRRRDDAVEIYENVMARGRTPTQVRVNMQETLGRDLDVPVKALGPSVAAPAAGISAALLSLADRFPDRAPRQPVFRIQPLRDTAPAGGASGTILVNAPDSLRWSVSGLPSWMAIERNSFQGDSAIGYKIAANTSNAPRSAVVQVGASQFRADQPRSSETYIPYFESFATGSGWILEEQPGLNSKLAVTSEGPDGTNSLVLDRKQGGHLTWTTKVYLPEIVTETGANYDLSVWLKAENPALVRLTFTQRTPPFHTCGLVQSVWVTSEWSQFEAPFHASGEDCGAGNNRVSIEGGRVAGKLWVAKLSLAGVASGR